MTRTAGDSPENRFPNSARASVAKRLFDPAIRLGLVVSTFAVYAQVGGFDFVNYDDDVYVSQNPQVQAGLTPATVKWAFQSVVSGHWAPVTVISHVLAWQLFGMDSGMHHLMNVSIAALAAVLLFAALQRATGARGKSAFVAFVFALHPLNVESVAWISERKDVLSAFFWFLALYWYVRYTERPDNRRYLLVAASLCLGLMSKSMLVTFPFTLLLLDIWPLRRMQGWKTVVEKLPLIVLSAVSSVVTYFTTRSAGVLMSIGKKTRIGNVFISYITYIRQMFWPVRLSVFYPYPHSMPVWKSVAAFAIVAGVSALAIRAWRVRPYITVGWFWYIGTLVPVIGLVQAGMQAHADRYMYIPMIGLLLILAWGAQDVVDKWPGREPVLAAVGVVFLAVCVPLTWRQAAYWQNSQTLFQRAIEVTSDNWAAENNLGAYLNNTGHFAEAVPHFEAAVLYSPDYAEAHANLGVALIDMGHCAAAVPNLEDALRIRPNLPLAQFNLGRCRLLEQDYTGAIPYFTAALYVQPDYPDAQLGLAVAFSKIPDRAPDAIRQFNQILRLRPADVQAHVQLGMLLGSLGRTEEAVAQLKAAQNIDPNPSVSRLLRQLQEPK